MTRKWLVVAVALAAAGGAAAYFLDERTAAPPSMTTARVTRGDVVETVEATGTLQAVTTVQVGTQVSGAIKALHADFNSRVRRGQVVAELDPSLFQTQVEQARATVARLQADAGRTQVQLEDAETKLRRAEKLSSQLLISASDLETAGVARREAEAALKAANAQVAQARASLNQSEVNLAHTIIRAPIDGVVISRNVDVGQTVAASMQAPILFVIARDLTEMQVNAAVGESDIGRITAGQGVTFRVDAYPSRTYSGRVSQVRLQAVVEQNVVSYVTVIDVPNPDMTLRPGMTATVTIEVERASSVLRVPNAATRLRPTAEVLEQLGATTGPGQGSGDGRQDVVWVVRSGRPERVPVTIGVSDGTMTALVDGDVSEGDEVLTGIAAGTGAAAATGTTSPLLPVNPRGGARGSSTGRRSGP
ncbi:MAG: efflux RND transporter periplasmic adaptor subunit [Vicinamibacterales bacterium]